MFHMRVIPHFGKRICGRIRQVVNYSIQKHDNFEDLELPEEEYRVGQEEQERLEWKKRQQVKWKIIRKKHFPAPKEAATLTWEAMEQLIYLHKEFPEEWTLSKIVENFPVSRQGAIKILQHENKTWTEELILQHNEKVKKNWKALLSGNVEGDEQLTNAYNSLMESGKMALLKNGGGLEGIPLPAKSKNFIPEPPSFEDELKELRVDPFTSILKKYGRLIPKHDETVDKQLLQQQISEGDNTQENIKLLSSENVETPLLLPEYNHTKGNKIQQNREKSNRSIDHPVQEFQSSRYRENMHVAEKDFLMSKDRRRDSEKSKFRQNNSRENLGSKGRKSDGIDPYMSQYVDESQIKERQQHLPVYEKFRSKHYEDENFQNYPNYPGNSSFNKKMGDPGMPQFKNWDNERKNSRHRNKTSDSFFHQELDPKWREDTSLSPEYQKIDPKWRDDEDIEPQYRHSHQQHEVMKPSNWARYNDGESVRQKPSYSTRYSDGKSTRLQPSNISQYGEPSSHFQYPENNYQKVQSVKSKTVERSSSTESIKSQQSMGQNASHDSSYTGISDPDTVHRLFDNLGQPSVNSQDKRISRRERRLKQSNLPSKDWNELGMIGTGRVPTD